MAPTTGRIIELDDLIDETSGKPVTLTFKGDTFELPPELPIGVAVYGQREDVDRTLSTLFGEQLDRFLALGFPVSKLDKLLEQVAQVYGLDTGESSASSSSSANGGTSSRPTSSASTD